MGPCHLACAGFMVRRCFVLYVHFCQSSLHGVAQPTSSLLPSHNYIWSHDLVLVTGETGTSSPVRRSSESQLKTELTGPDAGTISQRTALPQRELGGFLLFTPAGGINHSFRRKCIYRTNSVLTAFKATKTKLLYIIYRVVGEKSPCALVHFAHR